MKQYGVDLRKKYNKALELHASVTGKIIQRYDYLIKNTSKELKLKAGVYWMNNTGNESTEELLSRIEAIERAYVGRSKQLDIFHDDE